MEMKHSAATGRPPIALVLVAALHVGFIYIFNEALGLHTLLKPPESFVATVIDEPKVTVPPDLPEVRYEGNHETITVDLPVPPPFNEPPITLDPVLDPVPYVPPETISGGTAEPEPTVFPVSAKQLTQPRYPPIAIRNNEEGVVDLAVLVLRDGRVADVRVVKSSGYELLDRAAVDEARRKWRLQPARRGDVPIDEWGQFRVKFEITGR